MRILDIFKINKLRGLSKSLEKRDREIRRISKKEKELVLALDVAENENEMLRKENKEKQSKIEQQFTDKNDYIFDELFPQHAEFDKTYNMYCKYRKCIPEDKKEFMKGIMQTRFNNRETIKTPHIFSCWKYQPGDGRTTIEAHQDVIEGNGPYNYIKNQNSKYVWWAKFRNMREDIDDKEGKDLELIGESVEGREFSESFCRDFMKHISNRSTPVYHFLCNPNLSEPSLHVAKMEKILYTGGAIPSPDEDTNRPSCAYVPGYINFNQNRKCAKCLKEKPECKLKYTANLWFKLTRIMELDVKNDFQNIIDVCNNEPIDFSVPILYPHVVVLREDIDYFNDYNDMGDSRALTIKSIEEELWPQDISDIENIHKAMELIRKLDYNNKEYLHKYNISPRFQHDLLKMDKKYKYKILSQMVRKLISTTQESRNDPKLVDEYLKEKKEYSIRVTNDPNATRLHYTIREDDIILFQKYYGPKDHDNRLKK